MKVTILLSIIALLLINEISVSYNRDHEGFSEGESVEEKIAKEIANIPSKRDKYDITFKIYSKYFQEKTDKVKQIDHEKKIRVKTINIQRNLIENNEKEITRINRENQTVKRNDEIESREIGEIEYKKNLAMTSLIYLVCLSVVFLLYKGDIVDRKTMIVLYVIGLLCLVVYVLYKVYVSQSNVDDHYYKKYNFVKPSETEILKSKLEYEKRKRKPKNPGFFSTLFGSNNNDIDEHQGSKIRGNSIDVSEYINESLKERMERCEN